MSAPADTDALDAARAALADIDTVPVGQHQGVLSATLDAIVAELDALARTVPSAR